MSQTSSVSRSLSFVAGLLAVVAATCSSFSGFVSFGFAQAHFGLIAGALLLVVTAATSCGAQRPAWPAALWTLVAVYVAAHATVTGGDASWDAAAPIVVAAAIALGATFGGAATRSGLAAGMALSTIAAAVVAGLQSMGYEVPPPIPWLTDNDVVFALFDTPQTAAAFFAIAMGANAAAAIAGIGAIRLIAALGAAAGAVGLGLVGVPLTIAVAAGAAAVAIALLLVVRRGDPQTRRVAGAWAALVLVAAATAVVAPEPDDGSTGAPTFSFDDRSVPAAYRPTFIDAGAIDEIRWHVDAIVAHARAGGVTGRGGGAWLEHGSSAYDRDAAPAVTRTSGWDAPNDTYSAALQLTGDFGYLGGLLLLAALLAGFERGSRKDAEGEVRVEDGGAAAIATAVALGVLVLSAGAMAAAVLAAAALASVGGEERPPASEAVPSRVGTVVAVAIAMAISWSSVEALRWGYATAAGDLRLAQGDLAAASDFYSDAAAHGERFESAFNAALATAMRPGPRSESETAVDDFRAAIELREDSVRARYQQANVFIRSMAGRSMDANMIETRRRTATASLDRVLEIDPNFVDAAILAAQIQIARVDAASAVTILERMARRPLPGSALAEVYGMVGQIEMDYLERPDKALAAYRHALRLERNPRRIADAERRLETLEQWVNTGIRPAEGVEGHAH